jgi:hypothetical protein
LIGAATLLTASFASQAVVVNIVNPSFESNALALDTWNFSIDGWIGGATWHPGTSYYPSGVPDGVNVAWNNSGTISQTLTTALTNNTTYNLNVQIGHRADGVWSNNYTIELLAGSNVIASAYNPIDPGLGKFGLASLAYTAGQNDSNAGQLLGIAFVTVGAQVNYDAVSLNAVPSVPEPEEYLMMLLGAGMVAFQVKRKQKAL